MTSTTGLNDLIAIYSLNFYPIKGSELGFIDQRYYTNGKYVIINERVDWKHAIYVHAMNGKLVAILNNFKELEPYANEKI